MKCGRYKEWIALESGGDLPRKEAERLRRHLAECPPCRDFAQAMAESRAEFRTLADEEIEEAGLAAVRRGVRARIAEEPTRRFLFGWRWALAGAAALLITGLWLAHRTTEPNRAATVTERQRPPIAATEPNSRTNRTATMTERQRPDAVRQSVASAKVRRQQTRRHRRELQAVARETAAARQHAPVPAPSVVAVSPDVVRIQTPDPNVVVYWVLETTGNEEETGDES